MAEDGVTKEQLEKGNEPAFGPTLEARSTAEKHEAKAEAKYRKAGSGRPAARPHGKAQGALAEGLGDMHGVRGTQVGKVVEQQTGTQTKNAAERKRITDTIDRHQDHDARRDVDTHPQGDGDRCGHHLRRAARRVPRSIVRAAFEEEKGGVGTWLTTWGDDWEELIENSLVKARQEYLRQVDLAIDEVADCVDAKLEAAKKRVAAGRAQVDDFVKGLDASVRRFGEEALARTSSARLRRDGADDRLSAATRSSTSWRASTRPPTSACRRWRRSCARPTSRCGSASTTPPSA